MPLLYDSIERWMIKWCHCFVAAKKSCEGQEKGCFELRSLIACNSKWWIVVRDPIVEDGSCSRFSCAVIQRYANWTPGKSIANCLPFTWCFDDRELLLSIFAAIKHLKHQVKGRQFVIDFPGIWMKLLRLKQILANIALTTYPAPKVPIYFEYMLRTPV